MMDMRTELDGITGNISSDDVVPQALGSEDMPVQGQKRRRFLLVSCHAG